jgi:LPXTG-site transpeptidase (sortase) family protein
VAARWFSGVRPPADWQRRIAGVSLIAVGLAAVGAASWVYVDAWRTRQSYDASPEAAALARQAAAPTPIWITSATADSTPAAAIEPIPSAIDTTPAVAAPVPALVLAPTPVGTAAVDQLSLQSTDFRFLDSPQPGAHARVAIGVANHADVPSGRILLGIDSSWFEGFDIIGTAPGITQDAVNDDGLRTFSFPPVAAGATANYELHVTSTQEGATAPAVKVLLDDGDLVGEVDAPTTYAPPARPGPVMSIDIPRLKLHSGVVQVDWEPPAFTVGQIKGTADVTTGNTVLVGHLTGAAGNVFAHLDQIEIGDKIDTMSRGLPYAFVVTSTFEGSNTDAGPTEPEDDARLTLMTCAGIWNPFTHDYSKRLWVIAEPPDQAAVDIANAQATATVVAATATVRAKEDAAATATAVALEPTATPVPTPYAADPSLPGGIGNTRLSLEKTFGQATGETSGRLVVFHETGWEIHVRFTPDPPRAVLIAGYATSPLTFDAAVQQSRRLFPTDARPRDKGPEGNSQFVVERFTSPTLSQALAGYGPSLNPTSGDFTVVYPKNAAGAITGIILGLGDDIDSLLSQARV